jgi:hypothetical protein
VVTTVSNARLLTVALFDAEGENRFALFDHGSGGSLDMTWLYDEIMLGKAGDGRPVGFEITTRSYDGEVTMLMGGDLSAVVDAVVRWLIDAEARLVRTPC